MKIKKVSAALALALVACSPTAFADEVRLFATASFGDQENGFGSAEYGWGSGKNIFTLGASLVVLQSGGEVVQPVTNPLQFSDKKTEFTVGMNAGYTYLFNPDGNTGFLEGRLGTFDISEFSDAAFYEASVGYRWYLSDRAAIGWNIIGYEQRRSQAENMAGNSESDWNGNAFTRVQLIIALD